MIQNTTLARKTRAVRIAKLAAKLESLAVRMHKYGMMDAWTDKQHTMATRIDQQYRQVLQEINDLTSVV
jgi:hypothetical protein